ncbi:MAG: helical backbone metal receptor [Bacteroidota bacterium]
MTFRLALLVAALTVLAGCRTDAPDAPTATRAFTDDLDRTVQVPAEPRRVVTLAPSVTEMVAAAGGLDRLAARTLYDDYPEAVRALPAISTYPLDRERLLALGADLVVGTDQVNDVSEGDALTALGVPAVYLSFGGLADVSRGLRRLGDLLGTADEAEAAALELEARLSRHALAGPDAPTALVLISDGPLYVFGGASYVHEMVALAGGRSVTAGLPGEGTTLSPEWVVAESPDVVVVLEEDYVAADLRAAQPVWGPRVEGRVCGVSPDLVSRPGPRLADGIDALAACIRRASISGQALRR